MSSGQSHRKALGCWSSFFCLFCRMTKLQDSSEPQMKLICDNQLPPGGKGFGLCTVHACLAICHVAALPDLIPHCPRGRIRRPSNHWFWYVWLSFFTRVCLLQPGATPAFKAADFLRTSQGFVVKSARGGDTIKRCFLLETSIRLECRRTYILLGARSYQGLLASLLGTRALLWAPGLTTSNKKLLKTRIV